MVLSRHSVLALLGLAASINAAPANAPKPSDEISLAPPSQSVSWDLGYPTPEPGPEEPEYPPVLPPKPTDQISLGLPSYSVSWDLPGPVETPGGKPPGVYPPGQPSDQISLGPPTYTISWEGKGPGPEETAGVLPPYPPQPPKPSDQISLGKPSASISWDGQGPEPENPTQPPQPNPPKSQPSDQISLGKPSVSISWDGQGPEPEKPTLPPHPNPPKPPKPSDQISLGKPSASISWDGQGPKPTGDPEPYDAEYPAEPILPKPSDQISLGKPSFSVSWEGQGPKSTYVPGKPTRKPTWKPTRKPTGKPKPTNKPLPSDQFSLGDPTVSFTLDHNKRQEDSPEPTEFPEDPFPEFPEDPEDPEFPDDGPIVIPPGPIPVPSNTIGIEPPKVSISWGKRQEEPAPTDFPEFPEDPDFPDDGPIVIPPGPIPVPGNTIGIEPPRATISWGKRQEEPEPTDFPEVPEDPEDLEFPDDGPIFIPPGPVPAPGNSIGIQPPKASISWGKRQEEPEPTDFPGVPEEPEFPDDGPIIIGPGPIPTPSDSVSMEKPEASISWGKRQMFSEGPLVIPPLPIPSQPNTIGLQPPVATMSWYKREAEPQSNSYGIVWPTNIPRPSFEYPKSSASQSGYISWGKREAEPQSNSYGIVWPTNIPHPSFEYSKPPASQPGYITWGKRDAAPEPTAAAMLEEREESKFTCGLTTTVSRINPCPRIGCRPPCSFTPEYFEPLDDSDGYNDSDDSILIQGEPSEHKNYDCPITKTKTNVCPTCACPTTKVSEVPPFSPTKIVTVSVPKPSSRPCSTITSTLIPVCVPPKCPPKETPCDYAKPVPVMEKRVKEREIEKTIVTVKTVIPIGYSSAIVDAFCTASKTVTGACPTYTCVPGCNPAQVVR